jgi:hypothetical protein
LRNKFENIDEKGWLHIPGKDSVDNIDYTKYHYSHFRVYDTEDRIAMIVPIIKAMIKLNKE